MQPSLAWLASLMKQYQRHCWRRKMAPTFWDGGFHWKRCWTMLRRVPMGSQAMLPSQDWQGYALQIHYSWTVVILLGIWQFELVQFEVRVGRKRLRSGGNRWVGNNAWKYRAARLPSRHFLKVVEGRNLHLDHVILLHRIDNSSSCEALYKAD
jgi:hypothetical protein